MLELEVGMNSHAGAWELETFNRRLGVLSRSHAPAWECLPHYNKNTETKT